MLSKGNYDGVVHGYRIIFDHGAIVGVTEIEMVVSVEREILGGDGPVGPDVQMGQVNQQIMMCHFLTL